MPKDISLLFINPSLRPDAKRKFPPVGLACILTALKKAGYDFDLIDMDADCLTPRQLADSIKGKKYDLVGLGCIVTSLSLVVKLTDIIRRELPSALIVAGNSVATSIPELLLSRSEVDIASLGEGDITIVELVEALANGNDWRQVPGLAWREDGETRFSTRRNVVPDLDEIGFPDWNLFSIERYNHNMLNLTVSDTEKQVVMPLNSARGCIYNCTFCYHCFKGEKYRSYSEKAIISEVCRLTKDFVANFIMLWDELSFPSVKVFEQRIANLEKLPFITDWQGVTRANLFSSSDISLLNRAVECGLKSVAFSIENASPEILAAMNKKITHDKTVEHAHSLWKAGITPLTSIIFGYPQETFKTIDMTLDLCYQCGIYPSVGFLQPLPGTQIYDEAIKRGFISDEWTYLMQAGDRQDFHINMTAIPSDVFQAYVKDRLEDLGKKLGVHVDNPLKTGVYQKPKKFLQEN